MRGIGRSLTRFPAAAAALVVSYFVLLVPQALAGPASVTLSGNGTGTVTSSPGDINCSDSSGAVTGMCQSEFGIFEAVELTAVSAPGSQFVKWTGNGGEGSTCDSGTENPCIFRNRFEAYMFTATFEITGPQQPLEVKLTGAGSGEITSSPEGIGCGSKCNADFGEGSIVVLTAKENEHSTFVEWVGCSGVNGEDKCEVTMSEARTVEAKFDAIPQQSLEVLKTGTGTGEVTSAPTGIECGATCISRFNEGSTVVLAATPSTPERGSRYTFGGWSGCTSVTGEGKCEVTMGESKIVEAEFVRVLRQTLTVQGSGAGSGEITSSPAGIECGSACDAEFDEGSVVTLTATDALGSVFAGWSGGGCSGAGSCEVTLNAATSVTASFEPLPPPTAATGESTEITQTTAMIAGTINGQGADTHWLFSYGVDTSYGSKAPENGADAGVVSTDAGVSVKLTGLEPNTTYHYQLSACNVFFLASGGGLICSPASNLVAGLDRTLTTLPLVPEVGTDVPVIVGADTATVGGEIVAQGADTKYQVEYGTSQALGSGTPPADVGSATTGQYVTVSLGELLPNTTYYYRFAATNSGGEERGESASFTTNAASEPNNGPLPPGFSLTGGVSAAAPATSSFPNLTGVAPVPPAMVSSKGTRTSKLSCADKARKIKKGKDREKALRRCNRAKKKRSK